MGANSSIEWTDATWSPLRARVKKDAAQIATQKGYASLIQIAEKMAGRVGPHCEHVSHGCDHCYAETNNSRCLPSNGTGLPYDRRSRDLVEAFVDEKILEQPPRWKTPKRIFVANQSDLFGEWWPDEMIDQVFAVMALSPRHTFQVLTKRPERMRRYFRDKGLPGGDPDNNLYGRVLWAAQILRSKYPEKRLGDIPISNPARFPLRNLHLGVSVEDQKTADERIPDLLATPAAMRFVSYEPALGAVDFRELPSASGIGRYLDALSNAGVDPGALIPSKLDWIIFGGESGPGARPCDVAWARQTIEQCREAGLACFVKQLGAKPVERDSILADIAKEACMAAVADLPLAFNGRILRDRKGGDMSEWPEDLRVRQFPGELAKQWSVAHAR